MIGGERGLAEPIPGGPPDPGDSAAGLSLPPPLSLRGRSCLTDPPLREVAPGHSAACHFAPWKEWPAVEGSGSGVIA